MKIHTTNYKNTFIEVAEDSNVLRAESPPEKGDKQTVAKLQFDLISQDPYRYTSDDVLFQVFALRNDLAPSEYPEARAKLFSKGQACLRTSPLPKRYGWGIHHDENGKIAIYGVESKEYQKFLDNDKIKKTKAMKSSR